MRGSPLVLIVLAACGGTRYRTELVGSGNGTVSSRASGAAPSRGGIQLPQGSYDLAMRFEVPRAQVVEWKIVCPGVDIDGQVGEASDGGRATLVANARVMTSFDGVCTLQVSADDPDVRAGFTATRIHGADPAQPSPRVEAVRPMLDPNAVIEANAIYTRQAYLDYLTRMCDAKPGHRDRVAREDEQRREARLMAYALIAQRRDHDALETRDAIVAQLRALGAKQRPPRPAPMEETPGPAPSPDATWETGAWAWVGGEWEWQDGGWSDGTLFEGGGAVSTLEPQPGERDHRRPRERDHRDDSGSSRSWIPARGKSSSEAPRVRDHRDEPRPTWTAKDPGATVRDHRTNKDKDDEKKSDDKPRIRDHR